MATGKYTGLSGQAYWVKRALEIQDDIYKDVKKTEKLLAAQYKFALDEIQASLSLFYTKYGEENKISYAQAMKQMDAYDISNYGFKMNQLKQKALATNNPFVIVEMEKLFQVGRVARFQSLMAQIDAQLILLGHEQQIEMEEALKGVYESAYYKTAFTIQQATGFGVALATLNPEVVQEALTFAWSGDQFSERIWSNRFKLVTEMRQTITQGMIQGKSNQKMARELANKMDASYKNSLRLIRTETAYVATEATAKSYENEGVESYMFIGTLDNKTSNVCQALDGKIFKVKDKQVGKNASPMHPNCRSAMAPYFDDDEFDERRSEDADGNSIIVPNMNYEEWASKYLK